MSIPRAFAAAFPVALLVGAVLLVPSCGESRSRADDGRVSDELRVARAAEIDRLLRERPDQPDLWFEWAVISLQLGLPDAARAQLERARELREDPRVIEFIGHAHLARGEFGAAYELYRAAASKGWVVEPALDLARARLGDIVRHDHQIPGLAAVIEATCPRVRGSVLSELVPIEALAGRPARLREVDRVLLDFVAKTKPSERSEPPRSIIAAYLVETGRGFELSSARLDRGRTDDAERRAIADDLCRVADPVLRECELEAEGDAFVLTANGERERSAMRGAVDLARAANSILERVGSDLRFAARRLPYGGEALLCMREQAIARISN